MRELVARQKILEVEVAELGIGKVAEIGEGGNVVEDFLFLKLNKGEYVHFYVSKFHLIPQWILWLLCLYICIFKIVIYP